MLPPIRGIVVPALLGLACGCGSQETSRPPKAAEPAPHAQHGAAATELALKARVAENPADLNALLALANFYYDEDRPHRAIPLYVEVLNHVPDNLGVRTDLGTCYKELGHLDLARAEYERVLQKHPGHLQATFNLAVVSELEGNPSKAADLWERAAALAEGSDLAKAAREHAAAARLAAAKTLSAKDTPPPKKEAP